MSNKPHVACLGIGLMGGPMARRSRGDADALESDGATVVDSPADAIRGVDLDFAVGALARPSPATIITGF